MRIALDVRPLQNVSAARGVGRYVRSLIAHLPKDANEYLYLESRWLRPAVLPAAVEGRRVRLARPSRAITLFDQIATPRLCARESLDLLHATFYALPRMRGGRTRRVLTVHDLIPALFPGTTGRKNTAIFAEIYRSARGADAVIVPSATTRADLLAGYRVPEERIRVVPMGVGEPFRPARQDAGRQGGSGPSRSKAGQGPPSGDAGGEADERFAPIEEARRAGERALVYAGGFDASKNVPFLLEVMRHLAGRSVVLFIVGDPGPSSAPLRSAILASALAGKVLFLGRIPDEELAAAYRSADLFVSASKYEGFGLPSLEAMACGCPVVALATAAVPEVLSGAALVVTENDAGAFAAAVVRALEDSDLRDDLVRRGLARAAELTWQRTARATHDLYREVTSGAERA